jgi:hypothetical protein
VSNPVDGVSSVVTRTTFLFKGIGGVCCSAGVGGREGEREAPGENEGEDRRGMVGVTSVAVLLREQMFLIRAKQQLLKAGKHANTSLQLEIWIKIQTYE